MKRENNIALLPFFAIRIQISSLWKSECVLCKLFFICGLLFSFRTHAQPTFQWAKSMGGPGTNTSGSSIISDAFGNVYTAGYMAGGTVDFDPGPSVFNLTSNGFSDFFITKFDASGNFIWAKLIGGPSDDNVGSILLDGSGNIYVSGSFYSSTIDFDPGPGTFNVNSAGDYDAFILKLDSGGNFIWVKTFGGVNFDGTGPMKLDAMGNIFLTGTFMGLSDFDPGPGVFNLTSAAVIDFDIFVSKLDANGNFIWAKAMGGNGIDGGSSIDVDASGNVYTTGAFEVSADFDPGVGTYSLTSAGDYDIFVSKLDVNGNFVWTQAMGGAGQDRGSSICLDGAGNVYTTGYFKFTADFDPSSSTAFQLTSLTSSESTFISKLDNNGAFLWAGAFVASTGVSIGTSITLDVSGNIYTTGYFLGTLDFNPGSSIFNKSSVGSQDIFISKLDANGNFLCVGTIGGAGNDVGSCVATSTNGNLYTTGSFSATADFDTNSSVTFSLNATGFSDAYVGKYLQNCLGVGINENAVLDRTLIIYPNPVSSMLNILDGPEVEHSKIEIINSLGQIVIRLYYQKEIDVSHLSVGMYGLRIVSENKTSLAKFIKE